MVQEEKDITFTQAIGIVVTITLVFLGPAIVTVIDLYWFDIVRWVNSLFSLNI